MQHLSSQGTPQYLALQRDYSELQEDYDALKGELKAQKKLNFHLCAVEQEKRILEEELARRNKEDILIDNLFKAKTEIATPGQKLAIWALIKELKTGNYVPRADGLSHVPIFKVADHIGATADNTGKNLKQASEHEIGVERDEVHWTDDKGITHKDIHFGIDERKLRNLHHSRAKVSTNWGGDPHRVCPNCKVDLVKKPVYECPKCGIEYDEDMNVIEATGDFRQSEPKPEPAKPEPVQLPIVEPTPFLRRPTACRCGVRSRWRDVNGVSHCTHCEIEYRRAQ